MTATLTGQDIGELHGELTALLDEALAPQGISSIEYIAMRVITLRGGGVGVRAFLASQRQLRLDHAGVDTLFAGLEDKGLVAGDRLTAHGVETFGRLGQVVAGITANVWGGFDAHDLELAHGIIREAVARAAALRAGLAADPVVQHQEG